MVGCGFSTRDVVMAVNKKLAATGGTSKRLTAEKPFKKATVGKTAYPKTKTPNKLTLNESKKGQAANATARKNAAANRAVNTRPAAKTVRRRAV